MSQVITTTAAPVPANASASFPVLPNELLALLNQEADKANAGVAGLAMNILRPRRSLELIINGVKEEIPYGKLAGVMVTSAEFNHAIWYQQDYQAGNTDSPDLVWIQRRENEFPAALPKQYHQKIGVGKNAHWGFQIRRRTVWLRVTREGIDFANPFILDIPSSLLYGKSDTLGCCTWRDIIAICKQESMRGVAVYPGMFCCSFVAHSMPTLGLFYFRPSLDANGYIQYLPVDAIKQILTLAQDEDIKALAQVREKLTFGDSPAPAVQPYVAPASQAAPQTKPKTDGVQVQRLQPAQPAPQAQPAQPAPQAQPAQPAPQAQPAQPVPTGTTELIAQAGSVIDSIASLNQEANAPVASPDAQAVQQVQGAAMNTMFATLGI